MEKGSLTLVGIGIKFLSHLTHEAKIYIEQSPKLLYLVNEPLTQAWIQKTNPKAESLAPLYHQYPEREASYQAITHTILETLEKFQHVCVAFYGHPTLHAQIGLNAIKLAKPLGFHTKILPGISALDCLLADLSINPGQGGCQSYEATDFLIHHKKFDTTTHLILWQADVIGRTDYATSPLGLKFLSEYLLNHYPSSHPITLYEAAQYPRFEPIIHTLPLNQLSSAKLSSITTLYITPAGKASCDRALLNALSVEEGL